MLWLSGILFSVEMVEGKDQPQELGPAVIDDEGSMTCGLLSSMLQPVFHTDCYIVFMIVAFVF